MKKHWLRNLLSLLVLAALFSSMTVVATAEDNQTDMDAAVEYVMPDAEVQEAGDVAIGDNWTNVEPFDGGDLPTSNYGVLGVSASSVTIPKDGMATVKVYYYGSYSCNIYWSSSNSSVAYCRWGSQYGNYIYLYIYAGSSDGSARITISNSYNSDKATIDVTVGKVTTKLNKKNVKLKAGKSTKLTATYGGSGYVYCSSSNSSVASCGFASGFSGNTIKIAVVGEKAGTATVKFWGDDSSKKASVKVKVTGKYKAGKYPKKGKKDKKTTYRALLIGEESFSTVCTRNRGDVKLMSKMLKSVKGPKGGSWAQTKKYDLTRIGTLNAIYSAFKQADENDVSLFFIATHGDVDTTGSTAGELAMLPAGGLTMGELAKALKAVPGKVIVIIESCGSGAAVYDEDEDENSPNAKLNAYKNAAKAFDQAVIDAFSDADSGIVENDELPTRMGVDEEYSANTGELRKKNKFYVLTASRYQEYSWGTESTSDGGPYNYFTKWLTDGIKTSGKMPADKNNDKRVTLKELFNYISDVGDNYGFYSDGQYYYQHVQVYPKKSGYELFKR